VNRQSNTEGATGSDSANDWAYVQRVQRGEIDSFEVLVRRHQKKIFNLAYRMLSDYDEATEVAQDVFLSAFKSINQFRGEASFSTWIFRIALNHAGTRRKNLFTRQQHTAPADTRPKVTQFYSEPEQFVEGRETQSLVQNALNMLSPEHCEIITLIDMQGVSYEEAAESINIKIETVKTRLHRARQALKVQLAPFFKDRSTR
jgi:RNA polymerase sigma-70 factor (ECF subfamily)